MMILPTAEPPSDRRASVAVGLAPIFVAVVFTLIVSGSIAFDTGVAIFLACTVWVVYEMMGYQRAVDAYQQQCVQGEPAWHRASPLEALAPELRPDDGTMPALAGAGARFEPSRL